MYSQDWQGLGPAHVYWYDILRDTGHLVNMGVHNCPSKRTGERNYGIRMRFGSVSTGASFSPLNIWARNPGKILVADAVLRQTGIPGSARPDTYYMMRAAYVTRVMHARHNYNVNVLLLDGSARSVGYNEDLLWAPTTVGLPGEDRLGFIELMNEGWYIR